MVECPVCWDDNAIELPCRHYVHEECIIASGKAMCPLCRADIPYLLDRVKPLKQDDIEIGILDKLVMFGWLLPIDIPIIDDLDIPHEDNQQLVKGVLLLRLIRGCLVAF